MACDTATAPPWLVLLSTRGWSSSPLARLTTINTRQPTYAIATMKEDKLIADLKKELASKDALVKAKDDAINAKDETILTQRQALKAKDDLLASIEADCQVGQESLNPFTNPRPDVAEIEIETCSGCEEA